MAVQAVITVEAFEKAVKTTEGVLLVDFWAPWCAPCKLMNPEIEKLAEDMKDKVTVISVDVDVLKEVALKQDIQGVPTLICYKNGKEKDRIMGYKPANVVESLLRKVVK